MGQFIKPKDIVSFTLHDAGKTGKDFMVNIEIDYFKRHLLFFKRRTQVTMIYESTKEKTRFVKEVAMARISRIEQELIKVRHDGTWKVIHQNN